MRFHIFCCTWMSRQFLSKNICTQTRIIILYSSRCIYTLITTWLDNRYRKNNLFIIHWMKRLKIKISKTLLTYCSLIQYRYFSINKLFDLFAMRLYTCDLRVDWTNKLIFIYPYHLLQNNYVIPTNYCWCWYHAFCTCECVQSHSKNFWSQW